MPTSLSAHTSLDVSQPIYNGGQGLIPIRSEAEGMKQSEPDSIYKLSMPPKRDLPFPKPRQTSQARCSSASGVPVLPKSTPVVRANSTGKPKQAPIEKASTPIPKPTKKRVAQRKAPSNKPAQEAPIIEESLPSAVEDRPSSVIATAEDEPSPLAAKSAAAVRPASAASGLQSKATAIKKRPAASAPVRPSSVAKRLKMVDQSTQTQPLSVSNINVAANSTAREQVSPGSPPENYLKMLDNFVTKHRARPAPKELWEAPAYAESDEEARQILLNEFICDNLDNADFLQLCQDAERSWRRIGLGM